MSAVPTLVRAEGVTELVGDVVLACRGGVPTAADAPVPQVNLQIFVNTLITSRILENPFSEALLLIDEPTPANQRVCVPGPCTIPGVATPGGVRYNLPASAVPNVYQGQYLLNNSIAWLGVPIDAPGDNGLRTLRITNIRANASLLGTSFFSPQQIIMNLSFAPNVPILMDTPQVTVAYSSQGLKISRHAVDKNGVMFLQPLDDTVSIPFSACLSGAKFFVRFTEGFASSFKPIGPMPSGVSYDPLADPPFPRAAQATPGAVYFTETAFHNPAFPSQRGLDRAGLADRGTRLMLQFTQVPAGVAIAASSTERNRSNTRSTQVSYTAAGNTVTIVWEILTAAPFEIENYDFLVEVSANFESPGGTARMNGGFSPTSTVPGASDTAPIPRFVPSGGDSAAFTMHPCYSSLLFPFVSSQAGVDTFFSISNTSMDPFATANRSGTCTIHYYGESTTGTVPAPQTSDVIAAGKQLNFTLTAGGGGIKPTVGFQGYVIATCRFLYVHGFASVGPPNVHRGGYLGIVLDPPGLRRETGATSETGAN